MSGLREALEKALDDELCTCEQCEDGDKYNDGVRSVQKAVRAVVAAHPEPTREQIAEALFNQDNRNPLVPYEWSKVMKWERVQYLERAGAVLALLGDEPGDKS